MVKKLPVSRFRRYLLICSIHTQTLADFSNGCKDLVLRIIHVTAMCIFSEELHLVKTMRRLANHGVISRPAGYNTLNDTRLGGKMPLHVVPSCNNTHLKEMVTMGRMKDAVWLLLLRSGQSTSELLQDIHVPLDSMFLVAQLWDEYALLSEVYHISDKLHEVQFGTWRPGCGLRTTTHVDFSDRRSNLQQSVIHVTAVQGPPMTTIDNETGRITGFVGELWAELERRMNFRTELKAVPYNAYGSLTSNGTWTGMIALLMNGDVDVAVGDFTMSTQRAKVVDFTVPISESVNYVFFHKTDFSDFEWKEFLSPFSKELWITAVTVMFAMSICLTAIRTCASHKEVSQQFDFFRNFLDVYSIFCQQGVAAVPGALSCRLLYLGVYLTAVTLCAAYSATLVSCLAVRINALPFKTFEDLLRTNEYHMTVVNNSAVLSEFEETTDPILHQVYDKFILRKRHDLQLSSKLGLKKICEDKKFAFVTSGLIATYIKKNLSCPIVPLPEALSREYLSLAVKKKNPYLGILNHNLLKLRHDGSLQRLRTDIWPPMSESDPTWHSFDIFDVASVVVVLAAGAVVSILLLAIEVLYQHMGLKKTCHDHLKLNI
ncbi:hypothetical protein Cfor_09315 [Coptotermes formosanus]|uniref:Ionotropic glutamate receptor L-glutamate and glycine-binding domain-containing protein n=1 Tax=Coptotermes formosanus TaxID=36987 RepID=A0A6L2PTL2_COPFO|nr:hypothetical protein Cfor_09315 [Coptotermes formosanus]